MPNDTISETGAPRAMRTHILLELLTEIHDPLFQIILVDSEAGEIIRLVASVCLFACLWVCLVLCFAKYSKRSSETQVMYTLKGTTRAFFQYHAR